MAVPLDGIRAIHNAFRKDLAAIDASAYLSARQGSDTDGILKRYSFFNEVLVWHANGEEENVFPAVDKVAPLVAEAYERDHRGLDNLYIALNEAVMGKDKLDVARATAVFNFHLQFHLNKEEAHLYRVFNERISLADQGVIISKMAQKIPQERFPEVTNLIQMAIGNDWTELTRRIPELK